MEEEGGKDEREGGKKGGRDAGEGEVKEERMGWFVREEGERIV